MAKTSKIEVIKAIEQNNNKLHFVMKEFAFFKSLNTLTIYVANDILYQ